MPGGLEISIAPITDEFRTQWWSSLPYRHFEVEITVYNRTESKSGELTFEVAFPEEIIFDLNGSAWQPSHRHELDGMIYVVWSTLPGVGRYHADSGVWIYPNGHSRQKLAVNIKPYATHALVLLRLFEGGDPIMDWISEDLTLTPFEPHL